MKYLSGDLLHFLYKLTTNLDTRDVDSKFYIPGLSSHLNEQKNYSILRNPQITSNKLLSLKPASKNSSKVRDLYFGHLRNVVMISSTNMYTMQTADTDGDTVKVIFNDIYNKAVEQTVKDNKGVTLFYPELEGEKQKISAKSVFQSTKNSFGSRVGIISNEAFAYSVLAYNANDIDNLEIKKIYRDDRVLIVCSFC